MNPLEDNGKWWTGNSDTDPLDKDQIEVVLADYLAYWFSNGHELPREELLNDARGILDALMPLLAERQIEVVLKFQNKMADELMAWAKDTREAWREHNTAANGMFMTKPERRPDLRSIADGIEMAAHSVRRGRVPEEVTRRIARRQHGPWPGPSQAVAEREERE